MKVLWFDNEAACTTAADLINANLRTIAVADDYELDEEGNIIGKDVHGNSQPDAQVTTDWDAPHYDDVTLGWWLTDPAIQYSPEQCDKLLQGVTDYIKGTYTIPPQPGEEY